MLFAADHTYSTFDWFCLWPYLHCVSTKKVKKEIKDESQS